MAEMAIRPITTTNTLLIWPLYLRMAGTLRIAYIGIRNSSIAMIGPPRFSIMPRMLGFSVATIQVVTSMKMAVMRFSLLVVMVLPRLLIDLAIMPLKPSRAPR
ncbi:hypothetical protein D3C80_1986520 [compost metagenome]